MHASRLPQPTFLATDSAAECDTTKLFPVCKCSLGFTPPDCTPAAQQGGQEVISVDKFNDLQKKEEFLEQQVPTAFPAPAIPSVHSLSNSCYPFQPRSSEKALQPPRQLYSSISLPPYPTRPR